ncbi:MAG TPA: SOS response-associated peptidase family protein [Sphingopyxis sp.]|jgi:putative SOS response-associated peptidase YedK|uniref:SOS response-associated peptidase family protein n=1 Tax=Sphingopyxis sp. TaxID=1908224 RepID=UPI002E0DAAB9|nr:SOS response-associated peptidase family protein [Sphingopyxis sp.]
MARPFQGLAISLTYQEIMLRKGDLINTCRWQANRSSPQSHWFRVADREVAAFAGLWRPTAVGDAYAFLTCAPNPLVAPLHPKAMPVILAEEDYATWLDGDADAAAALAVPFPSQLMVVE